MSRKIALVVSDIDGTLITSNHELTDATKAVAGKLAERGIALSLASSRPPRSIRPLADALGLRSAVAAFNGAMITGVEQELIFVATIPADVTRRVKQVADELELDVWVYDQDEWWAPVRNPFVDREEHTSGFSPVLDGYQERLKLDAIKLTVVGNPARVAQAEPRVLSELKGQVTASRSKPRFLDVTAHGAEKGAVVSRLAAMIGIPAGAVAAIGDGPNDVEMFKQAGLSIAMGQAVDEVRAAADVSTTSNDDDGWARGIERFVLSSAESGA